MVLFCKDRQNQNYSGFQIPGFDTNFCNDFFPSPTDVGMCMTKNLNINEVTHFDDDYIGYMSTTKQKPNIDMDRSNRNAESKYVLLTDVFEVNDDSISLPYTVRTKH